MSEPLTEDQIIEDLRVRLRGARSKGVVPVNTSELADFYGGCATSIRVSEHSPTGKRRKAQAFNPSPKLTNLARRWMTNRLQKNAVRAADLRRDFGLPDGGLDDERLLAEALWRYATEKNARFSVEEWPRLKTLVARLPDGFEFRLWQDATFIANETGCEQEEAAVWLLCDISPPPTAIRATVHEREGGADAIELLVNPHLVTADQVRTVYRQLRAYQRGTADRRLQRFVSESGPELDAAGTLRRWNKAFPLDRYRSAESFRVALSRAKRTVRP